MIKKEKENQKQNQTDSTEHIHKNQKWIKKARINAQKKLTPEMFKVYCDYSDELTILASEHIKKIEQHKKNM